jgi:hypothetical protein
MKRKFFVLYYINKFKRFINYYSKGCGNVDKHIFLLIFLSLDEKIMLIFSREFVGNQSKKLLILKNVYNFKIC